MHEQKGTGTSEMKAFGQDLLDLGVRYMKAGKAWVNYRRNEMNHDNGQDGSRRHDQQHQRSRESGTTGQAGQQRYGQYRGSDYDDPRAEGESDFGDGRQSGQQADAASGRYSRYPGSGGYRTEDQHSQGRKRDESAGRNRYDADVRNIGGHSQNTGGYADEQDSRGQTQSGSHRNAQHQYGDPRGDGGSAQGNYGQSGQSASGRQGNYGQYSQSGQGMHQQGSDGRSGQSDYGHGGFGQSGQMADSGSTKGHRGKGPRSYSRSDERLTEDLNEQLMHDDDIDASDINLRVENGEVTLEGTVSDRWMKHRAEDLVERCSGVKDVDNRLRVKKPGQVESDAGGSSARKSSSMGSGSGSNGTTSTAGTSGAAGYHAGSDGAGIGGTTGNSNGSAGRTS